MTAPKRLIVSSPAFGPSATIPAEFTCQGEDVSPPLEWTGAPVEARAFAIVMDDPDAPRGTWLHWTAWDLPASVTRLPRAADITALGGCEGTTDFGAVGYGGPCPPSGTHRYFVKVYALDAPLGLARGAKLADVKRAIDAHAIAWGELLGLYAKK
ncbi:MAG: YbhB/YbcL family Raf kinase inhibitor-like protein [Thermoplasmatota archaeon]